MKPSEGGWAEFLNHKLPDPYSRCIYQCDHNLGAGVLVSEFLSGEDGPHGRRGEVVFFAGGGGFVVLPHGAARVSS